MKKGFTLIELLAVVLIMGILTGIAVPQYRRSMERSRVTEAIQLLPAIYESRDRLATEKLCSYAWSADCAGKLKFTKLDIEMKGKSVGDYLWETTNFTYNLGNQTQYVMARFKKGQFQGIQITYDGDNLVCCADSADTCDLMTVEKGDAGCDLWGD